MKSILLVDDETIICAEFERTLHLFGFCVKSAHSHEAAVALIQKQRFDLILIEFNLRSGQNAHPRTGNGIQLVRSLRDFKVKVPVLIFTAMEGELYEMASLEAGADDFIPKSTSIPGLVARLRAHIRKCEQERGDGTTPALAGTASRSR